MIAVPIPNRVMESKKDDDASTLIWPVILDNTYWQLGSSETNLKNKQKAYKYHSCTIRIIIEIIYLVPYSIWKKIKTYSVPLSEQHWGKYLESHNCVGSMSLVTKVFAKLPKRIIIKGSETPPSIAPEMPMKINNLSRQLAKRN